MRENALLERFYDELLHVIWIRVVIQITAGDKQKGILRRGRFKWVPNRSPLVSQKAASSGVDSASQN